MGTWDPNLKIRKVLSKRGIEQWEFSTQINTNLSYITSKNLLVFSIAKLGSTITIPGYPMPRSVSLQRVLHANESVSPRDVRFAK